MPQIDDKQKAAQRARVIASDMVIYPDIQERIEKGIKNDTLFNEIADVLTEGKQHFRSYVSDEIAENTNIFERAFIDVVFAETGDIESPIW
jgi:hypothetical protein